MKLIVETDIGHDPDDFFAITYLLAAGVDIKAILVTPGDPDQLAIARLIPEVLGLNIPIGASRLGQNKFSSGSVHYDLLEYYGKSKNGYADGLGVDILASLEEKGNYEVFVIGPVSSVGKYLKENPSFFTRATMQGGFLPLSLHSPIKTKHAFPDKNNMPTFNLNGDVNASLTFLNENLNRQMVGKNICHSILFDGERRKQFVNPPSQAAELFLQAADFYLSRHKEKKFHDPTAAVCHMHPEIATWFNGKTIRQNGNWTTIHGNDKILADIDQDLLWEKFCTFT